MCSISDINIDRTKISDIKHDNNDDDTINNDKDKYAKYRLNIVDLMAGNGNIAQFIAKYHN